MIKLKDILSEELKKSHIDLLRRIFSGYASSRNNKTSLEKLYKVKGKAPFSDILKLHKISSGTYYRGMNLPFTPEQGKDFKFTFSGWTKSKKQAEKFGNILFMTKNIKPAFVDINSFGKAIQAYIKKEYPQYDWDAQSLIGKPSDVSMLYTIADGLFSGENEVVFEPFIAKTKSVKGNIIEV